jgi:DNA-binding NarL/FixJ family response regulator
MKISTVARPRIRIALLEDDPLRRVGLRALLESESDLELIPGSLPEIATRSKVILVLAKDREGRNLADLVSNIKTATPNLPIIVIGAGTDDNTMLNAMISGAKGYLSEGASPRQMAAAIRTVSRGSIWFPRLVLSRFIELAQTKRPQLRLEPREALTDREREVLNMLVAGLSNKEIGLPLGIEERTVKSHVSKMLRKLGLENRIALSVYAITHSLVTSPS